ncbi:DUF3515 family protein [Cryobacterium tepidiphilum]|uniref:DUF3515 family protein n=1 Tax=Cryobacterium tepidiphilum TaxID=2486026 RepID=A0A3M8KYZ5_9MICO|nr:DUF3515 family protein [Cryobacterium tepidiphilum]RNE58507.1 DUF3515 family protein [Cryobacterium tepidiphilum]
MTDRIRLPRSRRFLGSTLVVTAGAAALTGCTAAVPLEPAPQAASTACADVVVHLPTSVAGQAERETNAQGTGAWGDPATVLLHCGVDIPGPTTLPCVNINGVDWINDDSDAPRIRITTYGRTPAVEVVVDTTKVSWSTAAVDLAGTAKVIPQSKACTSIDDLQLPSDAATPPVTLAPTAPAPH